MKIHHFKRCPLSMSNIFYQNLMKLGDIVMYHDVFFKIDNGPYRTMLSRVMALCLWKFTIWNDVRSLSWIVLIRILCNFVTLFSTMMFSSSLIMVYMAPCFKELLPFVNDNSLFIRIWQWGGGASVSHGHISSLILISPLS